jgi:hypothetical protein
MGLSNQCQNILCLAMGYAFILDGIATMGLRLWHGFSILLNHFRLGCADMHICSPCKTE